MRSSIGCGSRRALLEAAREVLAADGAHATVAAIAARAGVGIGSLYRRYPTKEQLFQRLSALAVEQWATALDQGLANDDPWAGLAGFVTACVEFGQGSLGPIAGTIEITEQMRAMSRRADQRLDELVDRAHAAGVLRPEVSGVDLILLIEQLGRSPLIDLLPAAAEARNRIITIVLNGLRGIHDEPLPGKPPTKKLLSERWTHADAAEL
ncbi:TetR/AcrR family transcriptional regulator [Amycolatopsis sp. cmx-4-54]|uniref:TetR/AcrR family transcriptional regulator n=1 Tax=Amycolatopsis sp. cmx-4-54 TaxID=2790936 RepID=UPI003979851E